MRYRAYAKINLALAVGPRRADGYHEIASVLCAISLHDVLSFRARSRGFALKVDGPYARGVPRGASNLVLRAARALAAELGETRGATKTVAGFSTTKLLREARPCVLAGDSLGR